MAQRHFQALAHVLPSANTPTHVHTHVCTHAQTIAISRIPEKFIAVGGRPFAQKTPWLPLTFLSLSWSPEPSTLSEPLPRCAGVWVHVKETLKGKADGDDDDGDDGVGEGPSPHTTIQPSGLKPQSA